MARQYQKKQHLFKQINEMLESGMTQREIADELGLTGYRPVHELLKRERRKKMPGIAEYERGRDGDRYRLEGVEQKTGKRRVFTVPMVI